ELNDSLDDRGILAMNPVPPRGRSLTPCGRTRREFLWQAGGGFAGTALAYLLAQDGFLPPPAAPGELTARASSLTAKPPHFSARATACICLFMYGGPSQVDPWDPKPELTKHNGEPIPNLEGDALLKARNPGKLLASSRTFTKAGQS